MTLKYMLLLVVDKVKFQYYQLVKLQILNVREYIETLFIKKQIYYLFYQILFKAITYSAILFEELRLHLY